MRINVPVSAISVYVGPDIGVYTRFVVFPVSVYAPVAADNFLPVISPTEPPVNVNEPVVAESVYVGPPPQSHQY